MPALAGLEQAQALREAATWGFVLYTSESLRGEARFRLPVPGRLSCAGAARSRSGRWWMVLHDSFVLPIKSTNNIQQG